MQKQFLMKVKYGKVLHCRQGSTMLKQATVTVSSNLVLGWLQCGDLGKEYWKFGQN